MIFEPWHPQTLFQSSGADLVSVLHMHTNSLFGVQHLGFTDEEKKNLYAYLKDLNVRCGEA